MLIMLCAGSSLPVAAQSSSNQFWPEVEGYHSFDPQLLLLGIQADDRSRIDLRLIEGTDFSRRYRNRITVQRTFKVRRFVFSPYAQGEFFYSSSSESWNMTTFQAGANFPFRKHFDLELYYGHDNNTGSLPNVVNAIG